MMLSSATKTPTLRTLKLKKPNDSVEVLFDNGSFAVGISMTKSHYHILEWWWDGRYGKCYSLIFEQRSNALKHAQQLITENTKG